MKRPFNVFGHGGSVHLLNQTSIQPTVASESQEKNAGCARRFFSHLKSSESDPLVMTNSLT